MSIIPANQCEQTIGMVKCSPTTMEKIFAFEELDVYQVGRQYVKSIYELSNVFPAKEDFALTSQIRRAAVSITSNIAEGTSRFSLKDKSHFVEIAYGSLREVDCQLDIAKDLAYISAQELIGVENQLEKVAALIAGMRNQRSASLNAKH